MPGTAGRWVACAAAGLTVSVIAGNAPALSARPVAVQQPRSSAAAGAYAFGDVTISIPPPKGFEDALLRIPDIRNRNPDTERLETLAVHLPSEVIKTYSAGQSTTFYTQVAVPRPMRASDVSESFFEGLRRDLGAANPETAEAVRQRLAEIQQQRGVVITTPIQLGIVDRTPKSITTLSLASVNSADRKVDLLIGSSWVYVRRRAFLVYTYRAFESTSDIATLTAFTKEWLASVVAANP